MVTDGELTELEALLAKATSGSWRYDDGITDERTAERGKAATIAASPYGLLIADLYGNADPNPGVPVFEDMDANGRLIVAAVNALPQLLAEVRRLRSATPRVRVSEIAGRWFVDRLSDDGQWYEWFECASEVDAQTARDAIGKGGE